VVTKVSKKYTASIFSKKDLLIFSTLLSSCFTFVQMTEYVKTKNKLGIPHSLCLHIDEISTAGCGKNIGMLIVCPLSTK
jgi:hypothetical protein